MNEFCLIFVVPSFITKFHAMYLYTKIMLISLFSGFFLFSCTRAITPVVTATGQGSSEGAIAIPGPPCIVYKTRADFNVSVPVILTDDKSQISSYPDVKDVFYNGHLACPTPLAGGYLLDNRGIGPNVAFLNLSYDEYSRLPGTPALGELLRRIVDTDPLLEMYQCGNRSQYTDPVNAMNDIIKSGKLKECKRLK